MKSNHLAFALSLVLLAGCATTKHESNNSSKPETVLVTYRVIPSKETEFEQVLSEAWRIYRKEHLVFMQPHLIVRDKENDKPRFVEIFIWVSAAAPDHAPDSVKTVWNKMMSLCEKRDGHGGLEGGEVEIVQQSK